MGNAFYIIDIIISLSILGFFAYMHYSRRFHKAVWYMFWAGVLLGATWEIGFYFVEARLTMLKQSFTCSKVISYDSRILVLYF